MRSFLMTLWDAAEGGTMVGGSSLFERYDDDALELTDDDAS